MLIPGLGRKAANPSTAESLAIICFSHLRWNFVYQRPQHLLTRAAAHAKVYFLEEPIYEQHRLAPELKAETQPSGVTVLVPLLPAGTPSASAIALQRMLLDQWMRESRIENNFYAWYYTPMALSFSDHLTPAVTVYDCMDELSAFQGAPPELMHQEQILFERADVVFAGGQSLFEAKRRQHDNAHLFPSSIDRAHFAASRTPQQDPEDQREIPHPRIGFFGVLDERLDRDLLQDIAAQRPEWHFVLVGPVVKICKEDLPRAANIHYLGQKQYRDLPGYLAHWDVAMLPFAQNASTRFISPTKTPEYLAAGKPVVSTPIRDVVNPYGRLGMAKIARSADEFVSAVATQLQPITKQWLSTVDAFLKNTSWDKTFDRMWTEVQRLALQRSAVVTMLPDAKHAGLEAVLKPGAGDGKAA